MLVTAAIGAITLGTRAAHRALAGDAAVAEAGVLGVIHEGSKLAQDGRELARLPAGSGITLRVKRIGILGTALYLDRQASVGKV